MILNKPLRFYFAIMLASLSFAPGAGFAQDPAAGTTPAVPAVAPPVSTPAATTAPAASTAAPAETAAPSAVDAIDVPEVGATAAADDHSADMTLNQIFETGGWLLWALSVMSVVGLAFVVYFLIVLTRRNITPPDFVKDVQMMLLHNRVIEAKKACSKNRSPSAAIAMAGIDYIEKVDDPDPSMLKEILEGEGGRQASLMQNQITYLLDIGVIAPMVGLLGTVFGMVRTFNVVALDIAKAKPIELAAGVSQALITTAGGLLVGIPAMLAYAYFRGRAGKLISNMEVVATEFLTALVNRKK